jgi:proteasome lid subunit RPN8/RPN11
MTRPKILKETRRRIEEKAPPTWTHLRPHDWLSEESALEYDLLVDSGKPFAVYMCDLAERKIREHAEGEASKRLEVMGFLLGEVHTWMGSTYSVVRDVVTTELKSSSSKVRFDPEAFPKLFHELDDSGFDYILVGWYHSHPGHTCFLSKTDLDTQRSMFDQPYHSALVIDPINCDVKAFRLSGQGYDEVPFAIFQQADEKNAKVKASRRRRLKVKPVTTV